MRTRPAISWSDLPGRTVGVWGLGVEGRATVRKLAALGVEPVLVDDRPPDGGLDGRPVLATGGPGSRRPAALRRGGQDPGISRYRAEVEHIEARGTPVVGALGLWLEEADRSRVLCVTGTKGKSTTTSVAGHLLARSGTHGHGRRQPRHAALRPRRPDRRRLLGHRGVELPGGRRQRRPARRGGDVAPPRPPHLARRRHRDVLRRQAVALHAPRRRPHGRQRRQPAAARPPSLARAPGRVGHRRGRPVRRLDRRARPARRPQPPQRPHRPGMPRRPRRRGGGRRPRRGRRRGRLRAPREPPAPGRHGRRRAVRRRQPVHQRAAHPRCGRRLPRPARGGRGRRAGPRHRLRAARQRVGGAARRRPWS